MTHRYLWLSSVLVFLGGMASCQQDLDNNRLPSRTSLDMSREDSLALLEEKLSLSYEPQRTKDDALAIASSLMPKLRGVAFSAVDVHCVTKEQVRGLRILRNVADTLMYIVNFKGDKGFALIAGDKRVPDVLAFSNQGYFSDNNNGLNVFLSRLPQFFELSIDRFEKELSELELSSVGVSDDLRHKIRRTSAKNYKYEYTEWQEVSATPLLTRTIWRQSEPYNNEAPIIDGKRAVTGCTSLALAQLLAYHKFPYNWEGISLDWDKITESYSIERGTEEARVVAQLIRKIGDRLGNKWGVEATSGPSANIPEILRSMGYSNVPDQTAYSTTDVIASIAQNKPVVLSGYAEEYTYKKGWWIFASTHTGYTQGHVWLADGLLNQERLRISKGTKTGATISETKEMRTLIHCSWGWKGGDGSGYFLPEVFDSDNPVIRLTLRGTKSSYYKFNLKNILYVTP